MKTEKLILLCIVLVFFQLVACERNKMDEVLPALSNARTGVDTDSTTDGRIIADKTTGIKQKEGINFTLKDPKSEFVMWRVIPAETVINFGVKSIIHFQKAGNYRVYAIDSMSLDTAFIDVWVTDEVNTIPSGEQTFRKDEIMRITPSVSPDSANILVLNAVTDGTYNCQNNKLVAAARPRDNFGNPYFDIDFARVATDLMCEKGENKPKVTLYLVNPVAEKIKGKFQIVFNNETYYGSFVKTGNKYEFDWPYESGVIFTTKSI
ncbi:hypothetical protein DYBT9623_03205 [Dyadobacter sp. CECT 9623]|uniref:Uncharacterized protein n=1 Tax=Dyadobacter linearis TaxID=2823330 RepID=A0ABM8USI2_9BACT|nr:hypothetical protein [Dyadobacter sp. CECT 9623]CAG5070660.1 hypothetical protein DYBT9623_03205 [Dyadobacter sp. CECT 9623]